MSQRRDDGTSVEGETAIERPSVKRGEDGGRGLAAGTILAGRYEVRRSIGRGGMGVVVEALDRALGVLVAIKIVRSEYGGEREWTARLAREVKLARQIHHPNVCRVFDFAQADGQAFLSMELAAGGTLRDELRAATTRARLLDARLADARALAAGLAAIHAAGIVHRDISPQNALRMADGRLVLSDFGLATDAFDGTSTLYGGTVAYMAPEVVRGGRATMGADLWALGAVIHEVVFGERLAWDTETGAMRSPAAARALSAIERSILELCYACVAPDPARRPRSAADVVARLSDAGLARAMGRRAWRKVAVAMMAVTAAAVAVVGVKRVEASRSRATGAPAATGSPDPLMIIPTGEPEDWTDKSKVLAEIPERVRCMVRLPDHHTVRLVWGYPPHAEDIDTRTGAARPSPLVPDAYAEGCPDLSADGKRLVYPGHTADDRAFAFLSLHPDGSAGVPVVPIAEPSMTPEPTWLPDGTKFLYEVDARHLAVFSTITSRSLILPSAEEAVESTFHDVVGDHVYATAEFRDARVDVTGFTSAIEPVVHFRLPRSIIGIEGTDDRHLYCWSNHAGDGTPLIEVDPQVRRAWWSGFVRGQYSKSPRLVQDGLTFLSVESEQEMVRRSSDGRIVRTLVDPLIFTAARCGSAIVAARLTDGKPTIVRLDQQGRIVGPQGNGLAGYGAACSPDGSVLYYVSVAPKGALLRCEGGACREIYDQAVGSFALSPHGDRIAFFNSDSGGLSFQWIWSDGHGSPHRIAESTSVCTPAWATNDSIWLSTRSGRKVTWIEFDLETNRPTGRTSPGSRDCSDAIPDPLAPVQPEVRLDLKSRTQVRLLPAGLLHQGTGVGTSERSR